MTCRRSFDIYYIHVLKDESQIRLAAGLIFVDAEAAGLRAINRARAISNTQHFEDGAYCGLSYHTSAL